MRGHYHLPPSSALTIYAFGSPSVFHVLDDYLGVTHFYKQSNNNLVINKLLNDISFVQPMGQLYVSQHRAEMWKECNKKEAPNGCGRGDEEISATVCFTSRVLWRRGRKRTYKPTAG